MLFESQLVSPWSSLARHHLAGPATIVLIHIRVLTVCDFVQLEHEIIVAPIHLNLAAHFRRGQATLAVTTACNTTQATSFQDL